MYMRIHIITFLKECPHSLVQFCSTEHQVVGYAILVWQFLGDLYTINNKGSMLIKYMACRWSENMFQPSPHIILLNLSGLRKLVYALPCGPPTKKQKWGDFSISSSALTTLLILKNENGSLQKIAKWNSDLHKSKKKITKRWTKTLVCVQKTKSNLSRIICVICLTRNIALLYVSFNSRWRLQDFAW